MKNDRLKEEKKSRKRDTSVPDAPPSWDSRASGLQTQNHCPLIPPPPPLPSGHLPCCLSVCLLHDSRCRMAGWSIISASAFEHAGAGQCDSTCCPAPQNRKIRVNHGVLFASPFSHKAGTKRGTLSSALHRALGKYPREGSSACRKRTATEEKQETGGSRLSVGRFDAGSVSC